MVAPALIVASYNIRGTPESWRELDPASAALLVEFGGEDDAELDAAEARALEAIDGLELIAEPEFKRDAETIEVFWTAREGLHGLVGKMRIPGTALIVEDVCVPAERFAEMAKDLQALLGEHGFLTGVAGHASAGNLHFMITPDFSKPEDTERYETFMEGLVELVVDKYDGSLKAEHGTGINMAPFVEREWGAKATELMRRVKRAADPDGVLAPGVVLTRRPRRPPAEPEDDAADRGGGDDLRRVWLLRAGLPEPQPDDDAAPADRPAPRDGAPGAGLGRAAGAARRVRVRRDRDLRRRRHLPARLPGRDRHRQVDQGAARARAHRAGPEGRAAARRTLGGGRAQRPPQPRNRRSRPGRPRRDARGQPGRAPRRQRRAGPRVASQHAAAGARRAAGDPARRRRRGLHAGLRQPDLRPRPGDGRARAWRRRWSTSPRVPVCRCGSRPTSPATAARRPWTSKGYSAGARRMANHTVDALWRWSDGGKLPIVIDASSCTLGIGEEAVGAAERDQHRAPRQARDHRLDRLGARAAAARARDRAQAGLDRRPPTVRDPPPRARRRPRGDRRASSPTRS